MKYFMVIADQLSLTEPEPIGKMKIFMRDTREDVSEETIAERAKCEMEKTYSGVLGERKVYELSKDTYQTQLILHHNTAVDKSKTESSVGTNVH